MGLKEGGKKLLEVMDMFKEYDVVMVSSWVYTHLLIHQVVYIKYIQLFVRQSHCNKVVKKKRR